MYCKCVNTHVIILGLWFYFLRIGLEAHGGYTFCGYAALAILGQEQKADTKKLLVKFHFLGLDSGWEPEISNMGR